jgi:hypothetical protein
MLQHHITLPAEYAGEVARSLPVHVMQNGETD